jgi:hypothetical protein
MAHIAKYKATSVGHMLAHYRRDESSLGRDNIDPKRVKNDMVVAHYTNKDGKLVVGRVVPREGEPNWGTVERRIERVNEAQKAAGKRATRKDAVVMADVVVTLPGNVRKGDEDRFFRLTYWYLSNKFGIDNMMGGYVHKDEVLKDGTPARDHMHAPFTPILDGRFNYKQMCPRSFYQSMHKELGDYLEQHLGYRPEIELEDGKRAQKALSRVDKRDIDAARAEILAPVERKAGEIVADATERAERASAARKRDEARARTARKDLADIAGQVDEKRSQAAEIDRRIAEKMAELDRLDGEIGEKIDLRNEVGDNLKREQRRLESVRQAAGRAEKDVEELEAVASLAERFDHAGRFEKRGILDEIAARCDGLRGRVEQVVDGIRGAVGRAEMAIADLARKLGPRSARMTTRALKRDLAALEKDMSPVTLASEAREAARASNSRRGNVPQRDRGQSR